VIELYWQRLAFSSPAEREGAERAISESEKARVARLVTPKLREQALASFWGRRLMLSRFLEVAPASISFDYGPQGLPSIAGQWSKGRPVFNLSHSGDWSALAVCWSQEPGFQIGIDLEELNRQADRELLAPRYFHQDEVTALRPSSFGAFQFFQIWTAKEAYLKSLGVGLQKALDSFCVVPVHGQPSPAPDRLTAQTVRELADANAKKHQLDLVQNRQFPNLVCHLCYPGDSSIEFHDHGLLEGSERQSA
jgi:4'-phosphopantetheinyl transferase